MGNPIIKMEKVIIFMMVLVVFTNTLRAADKSKPNIILVMSDDQGWGQTGYYNHPVLKTPNLDAMASNGLRFDRFLYRGSKLFHYEDQCANRAVQ